MSKKRNVKTENENKVVQDTVVLDFSFPTCFVSVNVDGFNNYMKDDNEAFRNINFCFNVIASKAADVTPDNLYKEFGHYHKINDNQMKIFEKAVIKAYSKINPDMNAKNFYDQNFKETVIYQIGLIKGIRLLGYFEREHHFKVVLFDYNHSIYPDKNYNEQDLDHYNTCIYERGHRK